MRRLTLHLGIFEGILFCFLCRTSGVESSSGDGEQINITASDLYFGVFISQDSAFDFSGFRPPLELGVDTINNSTTLKGLNERDYVIKYVISNGKVSLNATPTACTELSYTSRIHTL